MVISEAARRRSLAGARRSGAMMRRACLEKYYANPVYCAFCKKVISVPTGGKPSSARKKKYCNHSCAGRASAAARRKPPKPPRPCVRCGKPIKQYGVKFCSRQCTGLHLFERVAEQIEKSGDCTPHGVRTAKRYLLHKRSHKCEICGRKTWRGKPIPIVMDHINGNSDDGRLENLRLLCSNCNSQTDTFTGKNYGNGRHLRRKKHQAGYKSY